MALRAYARLSDKDKKSRGLSDSVEYQLKQARTLANGAPVVEYWDDDRSAWSGKPREDWERLRRDLEPGDTVIARHADRLTRDIEDAVHFANLCREKGVTLSLVYGGTLNMNDSRDRLRFIEDAGRAEYESGVKSERVQDSVQRRLAEGRDLGGSRPFGFEPGRGAVREDEARWIREAYRRVLDEGAAVYAVAKWLSEEGVPTAGKAELWTPRAVRAMLLRPRNAGVLVHKGVEISETLPAIVTRADWERMKALLNNDDRKPKRGPKATHLLSGIAKCAVCGYSLTHVISHKGKGRRYATYKCSNNQPVGRGTHPSMVAAEFEGLVLGKLLDLLAASDGAPDTVDASKLRGIQTRLDEIAEEKDAATQLGLMKGANLKAVAQKLADLEDERESKEAERDALISDTASGAAFDAFKGYVAANVGARGWGYLAARDTALVAWNEYGLDRQRNILQGFTIQLDVKSSAERITVKRK